MSYLACAIILRYDSQETPKDCSLPCSAACLWYSVNFTVLPEIIVWYYSQAIRVWYYPCITLWLNHTKQWNPPNAWFICFCNDLMHKHSIPRFIIWYMIYYVISLYFIASIQSYSTVQYWLKHNKSCHLISLLISRNNLTIALYSTGMIQYDTVLLSLACTVHCIILMHKCTMNLQSQNLTILSQAFNNINVSSNVNNAHSTSSCIVWTTDSSVQCNRNAHTVWYNTVATVAI